MAHRYEFPRPAVTVDAIVLTVQKSNLQVLLIERGHDPFAGTWALPGGFVDQDEGLEDAVRRELLEETHLKVEKVLQIGAYGDIGRDPRGHTIGVAFLMPLRTKALMRDLRAGDDARTARLFPLGELPDLAFDHGRMIADTLERLRGDRAARAHLRRALGARALEIVDEDL